MLIDFNHYQGSAIGDTIICNLEEQRRLAIIHNLNPKFRKVGKMWVYEYGELSGMGDTPYSAMMNFTNNFYEQKV